jgi:hypothetical protein
LTEKQKAVADIRRKNREQKEQEIQELEKEATKQYVSHYNMY